MGWTTWRRWLQQPAPGVPDLPEGDIIALGDEVGVIMIISIIFIFISYWYYYDDYYYYHYHC